MEQNKCGTLDQRLVCQLAKLWYTWLHLKTTLYRIAIENEQKTFKSLNQADNQQKQTSRDIDLPQTPVIIGMNLSHSGSRNVRSYSNQRN